METTLCKSSENVSIDRNVRVNAALPVDQRIQVAGRVFESFSHAVTEDGRYVRTGGEESDTIYLEIVSRSEFHGDYPTVGTTHR